MSKRPLAGISKSALLLVNSHARRGAANRLPVTQLLQELGLDLVEESVEDSGKLPELVRKDGDRVDQVI